MSVPKDQTLTWAWCQFCQTNSNHVRGALTNRTLCIVCGTPLNEISLPPPGTETDRADMWQKECVRILEILKDNAMMTKIVETYDGYHQGDDTINVAFCAVSDFQAAVLEKIKEIK